MITNISLRNYKAFKDISIDIKPITILLGANSVGKSSVIQLLSLLKQTAVNSPLNENAPLMMYGYYANMGLINNLFHNKNTDIPIRMGVTFSSSTLSLKITNIFTSFVERVYQLAFFLPIKSLLDWRNEPIKIGDREQFKKVVAALSSVWRRETIEKYKDNVDFALARNSLIRTEELRVNKGEDFISLYDTLDKLRKSVKEKDCTYTVEYEFSHSPCGLRISSLGIKVGNGRLFAMDSDIVKSDFVNIGVNTSLGIRNNLHSCDNIFECMSLSSQDDTLEKTTISNYLTHVACEILTEFRKEFSLSSINHVGPLRASPKRYYLLDQESYVLHPDFSRGESQVQALKANKTLKSKVNKWLNNFGFSVDIEKSEDVIHHVLVNQNSLELNIMDVGFGVSQILPILIQCFFSAEGSLTTIEQPEIHLHPQMQAQLANLFAEVSSEKDRYFIVETHSEYMLRRLRRLIADPGYDNVSADKVAIYFFEGKDMSENRNYVSVNKLPMSSSGQFDWPESFYKTELDDNLQFLKFQINESVHPVD